MARVVETLYEDGQQRIVREYDDDDADSILATRHEWKPGSLGYNRDALHEKAIAGRDFFRTAYANWPALTNADKDIRLRQAMRALANLCALVAGELEDEGI